MQQFSLLFQRLDETNKTNEKVDALADYFQQASDEDKIRAIALMSHRRPKRAVNTSLLRQWASEVSGIPQWLFEETYHIVGDLAETIAKILPPPKKRSQLSLTEIIRRLDEVREKSEVEKKEFIIQTWLSMESNQRFVFNKIITGGFRIGISQKLMTRALSKATGIDANLLAHRLMGNWHPEKTTFRSLIYEPTLSDDLSRPYPFYLAYPLEQPLASLGNPDAWTAERKWDGIRGQIILRHGQLFVWSRGEELVTDKYPEFEIFKDAIPEGCVMDGEIMPWKDGKPMSFQALQTRIGRKAVTKSVLHKTPVVFMAYDLLEYNGNDLRETPFEQRRKLLESVFGSYKRIPPLRLSPTVPFANWAQLAAEREKSRELFCEGLMIKRNDSVYGVGRKKGDWWKWKIEPYAIDAVLTFAMRGHGRRANLYTDYTFGLRHNDELVTFAKAYSGLTDKELLEVDRFVRQNTLQRFGPVRQVEPKLVFEIHFEAIAKSSRHKSGVAVRFPRIHRWRKDKHVDEANTLDDLKSLLKTTT